MGVCQLIRTLIVQGLDLPSHTYDIAGLLYFLVNIPILLLAWNTLGRRFVWMTILCATAFSLFYSLLPTPAAPMVEDPLTACLLGGMLNGGGAGLVLTCGGSGGGLDIVSMCLGRRGYRVTVGQFSLFFNAALYALFLLLFAPDVAIYSAIFNFTSALVLDRVHQQNISVQALIFTRADEMPLSRYITNTLGRGVTWWQGTGAYTGEGVRVLCVCLSKYEIEDLRHAVYTMDPHAFLTVEEGVQIYGNFPKKLV